MISERIKLLCHCCTNYKLPHLLNGRTHHTLASPVWVVPFNYSICFFEILIDFVVGSTLASGGLTLCFRDLLPSLAPPLRKLYIPLELIVKDTLTTVNVERFTGLRFLQFQEYRKTLSFIYTSFV